MTDTHTAAPPPPFAGSPLGAELEAQLEELWQRLTHEQQVKLAATLAALRDSGAALRVTVGNLKGGVAKSTTSIFFAMLLSFLGEDVLLIDADPKNTSCLLWKAGADEAGEWPANVQVLPWGTPDLAKRIRAMEGQFRHLIIDTGPQLEDILTSGLFVTDTFLIVCQPNPMDVAQIDKSVELAVRVDEQKQAVGGGELAGVVLLVRAKRTDSRLLAQARNYLGERDYPYLWTPILSRDPYADMFGAFPWDFADYVDAFAEFVAYALGLEHIPGQEPADAEGGE